jgi:hypothetical protein
VWGQGQVYTLERERFRPGWEDFRLELIFPELQAFKPETRKMVIITLKEPILGRRYYFNIQKLLFTLLDGETVRKLLIPHD